MTQDLSDDGWMMKCIGLCYEHTPPFVDALYRKAQPFVPPWRPLRVQLDILRGPTHWNGKPGTMLYAGGHFMADPFLPQFFTDEPSREPVGKIPVWKLAKTLSRMQSSADLTIVFTDWISARLFFRDEYLVIPNGVSLCCPIPTDSSQIGKSRGSAREDLRKIRQQRLIPEISHYEEDFEEFYQHYYVPYMRSRHGDSAIVRTRYFLHRAFRHGTLLWVLQDKRRVAGAIFEIRRKTLHFLALGQHETAPTASISACYYFSLHHAHVYRCATVDFGGSGSSPTNGLFKYKLKWGSFIDPTYISSYRFLFRWSTFDGLMTDFFFRTALFFYDNTGGLSTMTSIPEEIPKTPKTVRSLQKQFTIPGMHRAYVVSPSGWEGAFNPMDAHGWANALAANSSIVFCTPEEFAANIGMRFSSP